MFITMPIFRDRLMNKTINTMEDKGYEDDISA